MISACLDVVRVDWSTAENVSASYIPTEEERTSGLAKTGWTFLYFHFLDIHLADSGLAVDVNAYCQCYHQSQDEKAEPSSDKNGSTQRALLRWLNSLVGNITVIIPDIILHKKCNNLYGNLTTI